MEMKTMDKGIKLYYDEEPYYGVTLDIWSTNKNDGNTREDFINNFKYAIKNNNWLQQNMNVGEVLDFLDTLSNNLNGDALYENLIDNFYYVESLHKNSFHLGISDSFNRVVFQNYHPYDNEETISIFGLLTPYLKNHNEFKEWFIHKLETKDKVLYLSLLDKHYSKVYESQQENKKYKEVINKAIKCIDYNIKYRNGADIYQFVDIESEILEPLKFILELDEENGNAYLKEFNDWLKEVE